MKKPRTRTLTLAQIDRHLPCHGGRTLFHRTFGTSCEVDETEWPLKAAAAHHEWAWGSATWLAGNLLSARDYQMFEDIARDFQPGHRTAERRARYAIFASLYISAERSA